MTWHGHWRLESLVRERTRAKAAARHVLLEIAIHARSDTDETDVSTRELERWTGHDRKTVTAAVKELVRLDELEVSEGGHGRRNSYRVKIERLEQLPGKSLWGGAEIPPHSGAEIPPHSGAEIPPLSQRAARTFSPTSGGNIHHSNGRIPPPVGESSNTKRAPIESQRLRENRETDSPDGESQHRAVALVDVNIDRSGDLFLDPKGETPFRNPLTTADDGGSADEVPLAEGDLVERARAEFVNLLKRSPERLRPTLAVLGWDEDRDGKVTAWLARQRPGALVDIISAARKAQRTAEAS